MRESDKSISSPFKRVAAGSNPVFCESGNSSVVEHLKFALDFSSLLK